VDVHPLVLYFSSYFEAGAAVGIGGMAGMAGGGGGIMAFAFTRRSAF
jgi:hypothetical protein